MKKKCLECVVLLLFIFALTHGIIQNTQPLKETKEVQTEYEEKASQVTEKSQETEPEVQDLENQILRTASGKFFQKYPVDEAFMGWIETKYGSGVLQSLYTQLENGNQDSDLWYRFTGNSMHVLCLGLGVGTLPRGALRRQAAGRSGAVDHMQLVARLEGGKVEVKLGAFVNVEDILHPVFRQRVEQQGTALFLFRVGGDFDERAVVDDEVLRDQVVDRDGVHRARLVRLPAVIDLEERAVAQLSAVKAVIGVAIRN